jgi:hypothetical protein
MYWVGCLIGRILQRGTTYDEPPSQWMKLCPYSNSPWDNHLDMAAGRISFKHELPKQLAYLVLHGKLLLPEKLPNEDISSTRLPLGTNKHLLCRRSATIKVSSKAWEALRWGSQCVRYQELKSSNARFLPPSNTFHHILPCHFQVHSTYGSAFLLVHIKDCFHFLLHKRRKLTVRSFES